jgi:hypothetical protein
MFCRISDNDPGFGNGSSGGPGSLPARLRALPAFAPPPGGWSRMSARLAARRRRAWLATSGLALAASVVVAVALTLLRPAEMPAESSGFAASKATPEVARLIARSQTLERELSRAKPQVAVWSSGRDDRATAIEQRLRMIDAQLNFADPESAKTLWQDRVKLMSALVQLHKPEGPALQYASYQY